MNQNERKLRLVHLRLILEDSRQEKESQVGVQKQTGAYCSGPISWGYIRLNRRADYANGQQICKYPRLRKKKAGGAGIRKVSDGLEILPIKERK